MTRQHASTTTTAAQPRLPALPRLFSRRVAGIWPLWLVLFVLQYPLLQLLTGVEYGDAPRNLHWGLYLNEQPGFMLNVPDRYDFHKGFVPDPPSLAPAGFAGVKGAALHNWWGPVLPSSWALLWRLTNSYLLLRMSIPLGAMACVLVFYALARRFVAPSTAAWATIMLGWLPLFREHAVVAYSETFAALALCSAFLAVLSRRPWWAAALGVLAVLVKIDMALLYLGAISIAAFWAWWRTHEKPDWALLLPATIPAAITFTVWMALRYVLFPGNQAQPLGFQPELLGYMTMQMVEQFLTIPWYGSLLAILALAVCGALGVRALRNMPSFSYALLLAWGGLGLVVLAVYTITRGASNSPRVLLPSWPALAFFIAAGLMSLPTAWFRRTAFFLMVLFTAINLFIGGYQVYQGRLVDQYRVAWAYLETAPEGVVMAEPYWSNVLYAHQPTTWFEFDTTFEHNMLGDARNFQHYIENNPIRYVIIPDADTAFAPEVRAYLERSSKAIRLGESTLFVRY